MVDKDTLPEKLKQIMEDFEWVASRQERTDMLIYYADQFKPVPEEVATRPFLEEAHVTACESDAYVWGLPQDDGTMRFEFAVENPQGLSAMAMSAILKQTLDGLTPAEVEKIPTDLVYDLFGKDVSMGKGRGLMGIINMVKNYAHTQAKE